MAVVKVIPEGWIGVTALSEVVDSIKDQESLRKHFDPSNFQTIFASVEQTLTPLVDELKSAFLKGQDRNDAENKIAKFLTPLRQIIAIIVDQPFVYLCQLAPQFLSILSHSKHADNISQSLSLLELLVEADYKHPHKPLLLSEKDKKDIMLRANLLAAGFGGFGSEGIELDQLLLLKEYSAEQLDQIVIDSPTMPFSKIVLSLQNYSSLAISPDQFYQEMNTFIKTNFAHLSTDHRAVLLTAIENRARLLYLAEKEGLEMVISLCFRARRFVAKSTTIFGDDVLASVRSAGISPLPLSMEALFKLLKVAKTTELKKQILGLLFDCYLEQERLNPFARLILEILADFVKKARRRSSMTDMEREHDKQSKDSILLAEVFEKSRLLVGQFRLREESVKDKFDYTESVMALLEKGIEISTDKLILVYPLAVYIQAYKLLSADPQSQILVPSDNLFSALLTKECICLDDHGSVSPISVRNRQLLTNEVINCMVSLVSQDGGQPVQAILPEFLSLSIWPACFGKNPVVSHETCLLAHKLLVGFFDELPPENLQQASEKLLNNGTFEGLFKFTSTGTLDMPAYVNTIFLISRLVHNKKLEQYVLEAELLPMLLNQLLSREVFLRSYLRRGKDTVSSQLASLAEALFDMSHSSPALADLVEAQVVKLLQSLIAMQVEFKNILQGYLIRKKINSMQDESSLLNRFWGQMTDANLSQCQMLFEEFIQVFMHFFRKFLDVEATSLTVKLVEKGYLATLLELFCTFPSPNLTAVSERVSILVESFSTMAQQSPAVAQIQTSFLKKACIPSILKAFARLPSNLGTLSSTAIEACLQLIFRQTPQQPMPKQVEQSQYTEESLSFVADFISITFLSTFAIRCSAYNGPTASSNLLTDTEFITLVQGFVQNLFQKIFLPQSLLLLDLTREALKADSIDAQPLKEYKEQCKSIRGLNALKKIALNLKTFFSPHFCKNGQVSSVFYAALGGLKYPFEQTKHLDLVERLALGLEFISITALFCSDQQPLSVSSIVAIYEGGFMNEVGPVYLEVASLAVQASRLMPKQSIAWYSVDQAILSDMFSSRLAALHTEVIYNLMQVGNEQEKFFRGGVENPKANGGSKYRFIRLKLAEGLRALVLALLKVESDGRQPLQSQEINLNTTVDTSNQSRVKHISEGGEKMDKQLQDVLLSMLRSSLALNFRDIGSDREASNALPNKVPRLVIAKLIDFGFQEEQIRQAGARVRNPTEFNEMLDYLLTHGDSLDSPKPKMDEEKPIETSSNTGLLDAPGIDLAEMKTELVDGYKKFCQTLIRHFLFLPKKADFISLLQNYTNHVNDSTNGSRSARQFLFDLYYLLVDTLLLLKGQLVAARSLHSFTNFEITLPSVIHKAKSVSFLITRQIGSSKIFIELLCPQYVNLPTGIQKVEALLADIEKILQGLLSILKLAEDQAWTPACSQELKLVLVLYSDLLLFGQQLFNSTDLTNNKGKVIHRLRRVLTKCLSFIDLNLQVHQISTEQAARYRPRRERDLDLRSALGQKNVETALALKQNVCPKILAASHNLVKLNKLGNAKLGQTLLSQELFVSLLKTLTACVRLSPQVRVSLIDSGLLSALLRTTVIGEATPCRPELGEQLRILCVAVIEDMTLLEKCIECEVKYFFYALRKKGDGEGRGKEISLSTSKLEVADECLWKEFITRFSGIAHDHPDTFTTVVNRICTITRKNTTIDSKPEGTSGQTVLNRQSATSNKNDLVRLSAPIREIEAKKEISDISRKAVYVLLTEIVTTFFQEADRTMSKAQNGSSDTSKESCLLSSKMLLDIVINKVLGRYPVLQMLVLNLNFNKPIQAHCKINTLLARFPLFEPVTFVGWLVRVGIWVSPKLSAFLWPFLSHSPVLVYRNRRIVALSALFRQELIKETKATMAMTQLKIAPLFNSEYNPTSQEIMSLCLDARANAETIVTLSHDFLALKSFLASAEGSEQSLAKSGLDCIQLLPPKTLSTHRQLVDILSEPLGLLLKLCAQLTFNKQKVDSMLDSPTNPTTAGGPQQPITLELVSPESLLVRWGRGVKRDQQPFTPPEIMIAPLDLEQTKKQARQPRRALGDDDPRIMAMLASHGVAPPAPAEDSLGNSEGEEGQDPMEGAEVEDEDAEQYSLQELPYQEEGLVQDDIQGELEPVMTLEDNQEVETYRLNTEETEGAPERLHTVAERDALAPKYPHGNRKENPGKRTNVFLFDPHQDSLRSWVETTFPQLFSQFFRLADTQTLATALTSLESSTSASFTTSQDRERDRDRLGYYLSANLNRNHMPGEDLSTLHLSHRRLVELLAADQEHDRLNQRLFHTLMRRGFPATGGEDIDELPDEDHAFYRQSGIFEESMARNSEVGVDAVERRVLRGLRVVDVNGAEIPNDSPDRFSRVDRELRVPDNRERMDRAVERTIERLMLDRQLQMPSAQLLMPSFPSLGPAPSPLGLPQLQNSEVNINAEPIPNLLSSAQIRNEMNENSTISLPRIPSIPIPQIANAGLFTLGASTNQLLNSLIQPLQQTEAATLNQDQQPIPGNAQLSPPPQSGINEEMDTGETSKFNFAVLGLPENFLTIAGIDKDAFDQLPYDMQVEVLMQNVSSLDTIPPKPQTPAEVVLEQDTPASNNSNKQPEETMLMDNEPNGQQNLAIPTLPNTQTAPLSPIRTALEASVPANPLNAAPANTITPNSIIQPAQNLANQSRNNQQPNNTAIGSPAGAPPQDNQAFLSSLPPDLRREVLMTCPDDFLTGMPQAIHEEARRLRFSTLGRNRFGLDDFPPNMATLLTNLHSNARGGQDPLVRPKKQIKKKVAKLDPKVSGRLFPFGSNEVATGFLRLLVSSSKIEDYPFTLLAAMCTNPDNEAQVVNCLMSLLKQRETSGKMDIESSLVVRQKGQIIKRGSEAHNDASYGSLQIMERLSLGSALWGEAGVGELIDLIGRYQDLSKHVDLLLRITLNAIEGGTGEIEQCTVQLSSIRIKELCEVMNFEKVDETTLKSLGALVSVLCLNDTNLRHFLNELALTVITLCDHLAQQLNKDVSLLNDQINNPSSATLDLLEGSLRRDSWAEVRFLKVFVLVQQLYEKSLGKATSTAPVPGSPRRDEELKNKVCNEVRQQFGGLMQAPALTQLWLTLAESLCLVEKVFGTKEKVYMSILTYSKPILEAFFVQYRLLCDDDMFDQAPTKLTKTKSVSSSSLKPVQAMDEEGVNPKVIQSIGSLRDTPLTTQDLFVLFCERNHTALNKLISKDMNLLFGSMSVIPRKLPQILEFDNKKRFFRASLEKSHRPQYLLTLSVRREEIFADSFNQIISKQPFELKGRLHVEFKGEEGEDAGGVSREWFLELSKKIFYPGYCLFIPSASGATYQPSPQSYINKEHIRYFKFIGRVIGKALHDGHLMDAFFTRAFYKQMNGSQLTCEDMEDIDPEYYKSLKWILENDVSDLGAFFSYQADNFGHKEERELIEGGSEIPVTNENKHEYVRLVCNDKMARTISEQIKAFLEGLHDLIPAELLRIFDPKELELLISGLPQIDITDLRANTEYYSYSTDSHAIRMFWEVLLSFDRENKANFLQFVTGTSKVPIDGFGSLQGIRGIQRFQIHKALDNSLLPTSHTCMNQLDLPDYPDIETMREKLLLAITYGKEGFGFI